MMSKRARTSVQIVVVSVVIFVIIVVGMGSLAPTMAREIASSLHARLFHPWKKQHLLATANRDGAYFRIGSLLSKQVQRRQFQLQAIETQGSLENIQKVRSKQAHFGFIQGGLQEDLSGLVALANVDKQYVFMLVPTDSEIHSLRDLAGKRINLGLANSGSYALGKQIFGFYNLSPAPVLVTDPLTSLEKDLLDHRYDAALVVYALFAPRINQMLSKGQFRLLPIPNAEAVTHYLPSTMATYIPAQAFGPNRSLPAENCSTLAVSTLLVTHPETNHQLVSEILAALYDIRFIKQAHLAELNETTGQKVVDIPLHTAAADFYSRNAPVSSDRFEIASFFIAGMLALISLFNFLFMRHRKNELEERRQRITQYFHELLECGKTIENASEQDNIIDTIHRMMQTQHRAEEDWLEGKLDTEHMENLYAVYQVRCQNAFNMIEKISSKDSQQMLLQIQEHLRQLVSSSHPSEPHSSPHSTPHSTPVPHP
jgi:TRAP transporter TAXI family solute receptor